MVIDKDQTTQEHMKDEMTRAGYQVSSANTAAQALESVQDQAHAVTLGLMLPDSSGLETLATMRGRWPRLNFPVLAVTMPDNHGKVAAFAVANLLRKPIHTEELASVMLPFKHFGEHAARVIVIDDDPKALDLMQATLNGLGIQCICVQDGRQALRDIAQHRPDAIILDLMMPEFDGFAVLDALRQLPQWRDLPVFIWTSMLLSDAEYAALARSAQAILSKGGGDLAEMLGTLSRRAAACQLPAGLS